MKIRNDSPNPAELSEVAAPHIPRPEEDERTPSEPATTAADSAETSAIARALGPDAARIARIREGVRNGTYSVPARELSAHIIDAHLDRD
jgi:hypothetical protein